MTTKTLEKLQGLSRKLSIQVPVEVVRNAFDRVYKEIQKNATIKGFRPGKAPLTTIRSLYRDRVKQDVIQDLVAKTYEQALEEHSLNPVGYPKVQWTELSEGSSFHYTAELEVRPEVHLQKYEGLKIEKEKIDVTDENIDQVLHQMQQSKADIVPIFEDRGLQIGDIAILDFNGTINGQPMPQGQAKDYQLETGQQQTVPGFEDGLIGMKVHEHRDTRVTFPADYHAQELAGQIVDFHVTLNALKKKVLPELNDEFAASFGELKTLATLREEIKKDLVAQEETRIQDDLKNKILKALVENNPIEVPHSMVEEQKAALQSNVQDRMRQAGSYSELKFEEYKEKWDADFDGTAQFVVRSMFVIDALADKLNLRATAEDIRKKIDAVIAQTGLDRKSVESFYTEGTRRSQLAFQTTEEKVVQYLLDKADIV